MKAALRLAGGMRWTHNQFNWVTKKFGVTAVT